MSSRSKTMSVELLSINSYSCILNLSVNLKEQTGFTSRECTVRNTCWNYRIDSVAVSYISANACDSSVALRFSITLV